MKLMAKLGNVRIPLQVDVGTGDAVVPPPELLDFPGLLDLPRARLRMYRPETSIAERTEAMIRLGMANSRMKDFFDIHELAATREFDGDVLRRVVMATFARRGTEAPRERPLALTTEFANNAQKGAVAPFVRRTRLTDEQVLMCPDIMSTGSAAPSRAASASAMPAVLVRAGAAPIDLPLNPSPFATPPGSP